MTPTQKDLVRESWSKVLPIQETAAELFYGRLFSEYPEVAPLFKGDMKEQGEKLMKMLDQAVGSLDNIDALEEPLKQSGRAHRAYGVKEEDYGKVASCLLWTLGQGLGDAFDKKTKEAWVVTYQALSEMMISGADYQTAIPAQAKKKPWFKRMLSRATA
ncbi:MAG: globin family protein [Granulosicoccus sp.]